MPPPGQTARLKQHVRPSFLSFTCPLVHLLRCHRLYEAEDSFRCQALFSTPLGQDFFYFCM